MRAVFLDRDGVINGMVYSADFGTVDSPANPDEFELLPGVGAAVKRLNQMDLLAIVVSNQPGVAKGKFTPALLESTREKMHRQLAAAGARLDAVYYCLHHPEARLDEFRVRCNCRKPRPGMLLQAAEEWQIDLASSYLVGDGITDIKAGQAAGCTTIMVNSRKCYICDELARQGVEPDYLAPNLSAAVAIIEALENGDAAAVHEFHFRCELVTS